MQRDFVLETWLISSLLWMRLGNTFEKSQFHWERTNLSQLQAECKQCSCITDWCVQKAASSPCSGQWTESGIHLVMKGCSTTSFITEQNQCCTDTSYRQLSSTSALCCEPHIVERVYCISVWNTTTNTGIIRKNSGLKPYFKASK